VRFIPFTIAAVDCITSEINDIEISLSRTLAYCEEAKIQDQNEDEISDRYQGSEKTHNRADDAGDLTGLHIRGAAPCKRKQTCDDPGRSKQYLNDAARKEQDREQGCEDRAKSKRDRNDPEYDRGLIVYLPDRCVHLSGSPYEDIIPAPTIRKTNAK
jgi:hypothetical protein